MYTLLFNNKNLHLIECDQENRHSNNTTETSNQTNIYLHDLPSNENYKQANIDFDVLCSIELQTRNGKEKKN